MRGTEMPRWRGQSRQRTAALLAGTVEKEQREQRQDPGVFVTGGGQLDVLNDPVIDAEQ